MNPSTDTFAARLRAEKARLRLTEQALARTLEVGHRTLQRWLAGEAEPLVIAQEGALARLRRKRRS